MKSKPRTAPATYRMTFDIRLPVAEEEELATLLEIAAESLVVAVRYVHGPATQSVGLGVVEDTCHITELSPLTPNL